VVREPLRALLDWDPTAPPAAVVAALGRAARGPYQPDWTPPPWLLPHQATAARCLAARLELFRGALLADAVGLGKTYVASAIATRYPSAALLAPAALLPQWRRVTDSLGVRLAAVSHEALSRGLDVPPGHLLVVDEAHRFRNPDTRRYAVLARAALHRHLLLLTATPVVNRAQDLVNLLRLWLPDHALAPLGIPSLGAAPAARTLPRLAHAACAVMVARSPDVVRVTTPALPAVHDAAVLDPPPVSCEYLDQIAQGIADLAFPSFADRQAAELLRLHLWHRLASSAAAFGETLRRHLAYLDRAIVAAERGQALSRAAARILFGTEDDLQLELDGWGSGPGSLDVAALAAERDRIGRLRALIASASREDPKAQALATILADRAASKTLVFTSAVATARGLARRLGWDRIGVATARGARIASGPVPLEQVLAWFAPRARRSSPPPATLRLDTLIATDLLSEGLDLQDADGIVHYDLPWTPLRLAQRLGRIARLDCLHGQISVWWLRPCEQIERHLDLARRLDLKLQDQLRLGVPASGRVGRALLVGGMFDWRERLATAYTAFPAPGPARPLLAVVRGPRAAALALKWTLGNRDVPELLVLAGDPPAVLEDEKAAGRLVELLAQAPAAPGEASAAISTVRAALASLVRGRLKASLNGPRDDETRRLSRRVLRLAARAAHARDPQALLLLDQILDRLTAGLPIGPLRDLDRLLEGPPHKRALRQWLDHTTPTPRPYPQVALEAVLLGDGSIT
jgi:superfamily II DNA or RNA helicase